MHNDQSGNAIEPISTSSPIHCPRLPLAVYREVAAHLRQVTGIAVELLPQTAPEFDYLSSQVGGLQIHYSDATDRAAHQRVVQILAYYGDRYGSWQVVR